MMTKVTEKPLCERLADLANLIERRDAEGNPVKANREMAELIRQAADEKGAIDETGTLNLEWMTDFYLPLNIIRDADGEWNVIDNSTDQIVASAWCAHEALANARAALKEEV